MLFNVIAYINLRGYVVPDGEFENSDAINLETDTGYHDSECVDFRYSLTFQVEALNEDDARVQAMDILDEMRFRSSGSEVEWEIDNYDVEDIEAVEIPMTLERATELIEAWIAAHPNAEEMIAVLRFLLALATTNAAVAA